MRISWNQGAALSIPRAVHAAGIVDGKLVVAGGSCWPAPDRKERLRRVDIYDPVRDAWQRGQDLPVGIDGAVGGAIDNRRLIVAGGFDGVAARTDVLSGDGQGAWETIALLPGGRSLACAAIIDHYLYVCGGTQRPDTIDDDLPTLFRVDTRGTETMASRVKTCRRFPGVARAISAAAIDGALFVFGGASIRAGKVVNSREVWRYTPKTDLWQRLPDAPRAVRGWGAVALQETRAILLLGGYCDDEPGIAPGFRQAIWEFDTVRYRWSRTGELLLAAGGEDAPRHRSAATLRGQIRVGAGKG